MKNIVIKKAELLVHLKANRDAHELEYAEAMMGYREALVKELKSLLKEAQAGKNIKHMIDVVRPDNYTSSYNDIIEMLEWNLETEIELDQTEFKTYVQDDWGWKRTFALQASTYNTKGLK